MLSQRASAVIMWQALEQRQGFVHKAGCHSLSTRTQLKLQL